MILVCHHTHIFPSDSHSVVVHTVSYTPLALFSDFNVSASFYGNCLVYFPIFSSPLIFPLLPLPQYHYQDDESPPEHSYPRLTGEVRAPELVHVSERNLSEIENVHGYVSHSHISPLKVCCMFFYHYKHHERLLPWSSICLPPILTQVPLYPDRRCPGENQVLVLTASKKSIAAWYVSCTTADMPWYPACPWALLHNQEHQRV